MDHRGEMQAGPYGAEISDIQATEPDLAAEAHASKGQLAAEEVEVAGHEHTPRSGSGEAHGTWKVLWSTCGDEVAIHVWLGGLDVCLSLAGYRACWRKRNATIQRTCLVVLIAG